MYAKYYNGTIKLFSSIPKIYNGDFAFSKRSETVHKEAGFYPVVQPELTEDEKRGEPYFDSENEVFTYAKVALTPEEIAQKEEDKLNSDAAQQAIDQRRADGQIGLDRIFARIERKYRNGEITANQAKAAIEILYPLVEPLYKGLWILAQVRLDGATIPSALQSLYDEIKTKVENYITNNY